MLILFISLIVGTVERLITTQRVDIVLSPYGDERSLEAIEVSKTTILYLFYLHF